jgi:SAM-dependent methyltransferase
VDQVFEQIYTSRIWGKGSGEGSDPAYCRRYVEVLQKIMQDCGVRSVLDLGCGDWLHGFSRYVEWGDVHYTGIDVVASVVDQNQQAFGSERIQFRHGNVVACDLPRTDLILFKDVLQHWSNASVLGLLPRLKSFKFALVTNDLFSSMPRVLNQDIADGDYRPIDIMAPPFNVPGSEVMLYTNATYHPAESVRWLKKMILIRN